MPKNRETSSEARLEGVGDRGDYGINDNRSIRLNTLAYSLAQSRRPPGRRTIFG